MKIKLFSLWSMVLNLILAESGGKLNINEFQGSKIFISRNLPSRSVVDAKLKLN